MLLGLLVLITALSISAVAIYYSVAGLVAIFAAAALPIMIMGGVLEISKLVTTVWLHKYWSQATWWLKTYLSFAIVILMVITSMGIFGFLSKAHVEQTAKATESVQRIEQIAQEISAQQDKIAKAESRIQSLESQGSGRDSEIQSQIDTEQQRIDTAYSRVEPAIQEQRDIITARQEERNTRIAEVEAQIAAIQTDLQALQTALSSNQIRDVQTIVSVRPDGSLGPGTQRAIDAYRANKEQSLASLNATKEAIRAEVDPRETAAQEEINRLRAFAEQQISDSNALIARLRAQIGTTDVTQINSEIQSQRTIISETNTTIDSLTEEKYTLETEYRKLEAEVGPIKYIAEFIYGNSTDQDLLEKAVRWVIILIIFVFDPLAVLLLIASQYTFEINKKNKESKHTTSLEIGEPTEKENESIRTSNVVFVEDVRAEPGEVAESTRSDGVSGGTTEETNSAIVAGVGTETVAGSTGSEITDLDPEDSKKKTDIESSEESNQILSFKEQRALIYAEKELNDLFHSEKEAWKHDHPDQTLKIYKTLFINGKIDKLPWEGYQSTYKQNEEQREDSLFNKLKQRPGRDNS